MVIHLTANVHCRLIEENRQVKGRRINVEPGQPEPRYDLNWDDYYQHDVINAFLEELAANNEWAEVVTIGQSYEGRDGGQQKPRLSAISLSFKP